MTNSDFPVVPVERLELAYAPWEWPFATERRAEIDAYFAEVRRKTPELWDGRILMLRDYAIKGGVFRAKCFEAGFADLLAWRDWGFPDNSVQNFFAMGALRGSDGAFVLGEMSAYTANPGRIYFAAGTPDPQDVQGDAVDLDASLTREVEEETGLTPADYTAAPGWFAVLNPRIAHMKLLQARLPAAELAERINAFIATETQPELTRAHIARGPADLSPAFQPFVTAFLRYVWSSSL